MEGRGSLSYESIGRKTAKNEPTAHSAASRKKRRKQAQRGNSDSNMLWSEKYRPKKFMDLLGDQVRVDGLITRQGRHVYIDSTIFSVSIVKCYVGSRNGIIASLESYRQARINVKHSAITKARLDPALQERAQIVWIRYVMVYSLIDTHTDISFYR